MEEQKKPIEVWPFDDAPPEWKALSPHGGDEDWLAFVPSNLWKECGQYIGWLESGQSFGLCDTSQHEVMGGFVFIGAHA